MNKQSNVTRFPIGYEYSDDSEVRRRYGLAKRVRRMNKQHKLLNLIGRSLKRSH